MKERTIIWDRHTFGGFCGVRTQATYRARLPSLKTTIPAGWFGLGPVWVIG